MSNTLESPLQKLIRKSLAVREEKVIIPTNEEKQVIIHCLINPPTYIRIWRSTFLYAKNSSHRSKLVHAENIPLYPTWMPVLSKKKKFTLIFTGLPQGCKQFDLIEKIPEPGGWVVKNIKRNKTDVYFLEL